MSVAPSSAPLLEVVDLHVHFGARGRRARRHAPARAVDGVNLDVREGEVLALVGESGCGKTTLARTIMGLERPVGGEVRFEGRPILGRRGGGLHAYRKRVQMVFQDPYAALNPLHTVEYTVMRPCQNFLRMPPARARERVYELLETVGLTPPAQFAGKLPHQLSGGQRQRVVIARALACDPELIVADEPVSMLDVSLRADVLRLLASLRAKRGLSLLYITHDLLGARVISDEILVLNKGKVVEQGSTKQVLQHPKHQYTMQLLDAVATPFAAAGTSPSQ